MFPHQMKFDIALLLLFTRVYPITVIDIVTATGLPCTVVPLLSRAEKVSWALYVPITKLWAFTEIVIVLPVLPFLPEMLERVAQLLLLDPVHEIGKEQLPVSFNVTV